MKNKFLLPIFLFLFLSNINAQDRLWQGGIFFSIDQMSMDYTLTENFIEGSTSPSSTHASVGVRLERKCSKRWIIQSGLSVSKMNFNSGMYLPWAYGTTFKFDQTEETLLGPVLHQHEMSVLSIPLGIKYNFAPNKKWQPYLSLGINSSVKYRETEIYKETFFLISEEEQKTLHIKDPGIQLFNLGLDVEAGIQFQINSLFKVVLAPGIRVVEYRNENEKFKRNGDFLYQKQWLNWTQKKLSIGLLVAL